MAAVFFQFLTERSEASVACARSARVSSVAARIALSSLNEFSSFWLHDPESMSLFGESLLVHVRTLNQRKISGPDMPSDQTFYVVKPPAQPSSRPPRGGGRQRSTGGA